ncbi:nuclear transport factor 2 family protein [Solimonas marina]|uniref:Nuclear transport factor 2 family protein n=1 Tax=Solimonas marina TaxID=2714601 RepID=A0A970B341_9GAMM|nr:nuclear transport factor 2 family protein [Solimonas marina]NKF20827.1 nuclear transport factor 2 family protein [Solimonas marina]
MDGIERLLAIEAIRGVKARYFRGVDGKDAALLREVFVDGAITDFRSESPDRDAALLQRDPDAFVRKTLALLDGTVTVHSAAMPEIELLDADEALGRWTMHDRIWVVDAERCRLPFRALRGWGYYHDRYRRVGGQWRIAETRLERLQVLVE